MSLALCFAVVRIWGAAERASEWATTQINSILFDKSDTNDIHRGFKIRNTSKNNVFLGIATQFGQLGRLFKPSKEMS